MPIYEFQCNTCAHLFDELVPMNTQGDLMKCPKCSSVGAKKARGSYLSATHGLENGHIAVGHKLTGKSSAPSSSDSGSGSDSGSDNGSTPAAGSSAPSSSASGSTPAAASSSTPATGGSAAKAAGA